MSWVRSANRSEALPFARELEAKFVKAKQTGAMLPSSMPGENDKVFEWLEKDFHSRCSPIAELRSEVPFMPLRKDPRFKDLLTRMGLPE